MNFYTATATCLHKYVVFTGRAGRPEFWWFLLFQAIATFLASLVDYSLFGTDTIRFGIGGWGDSGPMATAVWLLLLLPTLAVGARRLHDTGRSAWWLLLLLIPCLGLIVLVVLFCLRGDPNENRYGSAPA